MKAAPKVYVYGLVEAGAATPDGLKGLFDGLVHILPVGDINAIVSDFGNGTLSGSRENVVAHEKVLEAVMEQSTPLPFRFGTIAGTDTLAGFVAQHSAALLADFDRVRGCVQMTVRLVLKSAAPTEVPAGAEEGPGSRFLHQKQARTALLRSEAEALNESLKQWIRSAEVHVQTAPRSMATAAHLVMKSNLESYRAALDTYCSEKTNIAWLRSGPWPPYSFVSVTKK